ncbi:sulfotransferase [Thalassotalea sp. 1_MG-2023]|uniref:tetratricopeptide repeat-containing sulfotransferase family protein n=1 Tax=Thalassotalea sp. 1_MG-2023 TaxID=3062680 RepID=UPI0026E28C0F|nr:sulfotransferase [Thalassotalea sp. 1_MG-2023]MDO6426507.1 sulfotransferase [Thalassotalea sp. 1_MG-2023]
MKQDKIDKILTKASTAIKTKKFSQAVTSLKKLNDSISLRSYRSLMLEANALSELKKNKQLLQTLYKLNQLELTKEQKVIVLGYIGCVLRDLTFSGEATQDEAISFLEQSVKLDSSVNNAHNQLILCELYQETKRFKESELLANNLIKWSAYFSHAQYQLILIARSQRDKELVVSRTKHLSNHFKQIDDKYIEEAIESLNFVGAEDDAYLLLQKAQSHLGSKNWMKYPEAVYWYGQKEYEKVTNLITDTVISTTTCPKKLKKLYSLRGNAFDKLKLYDDAFQDFSTLGALKEKIYKNKKVTDYAAVYEKLNLTSLPKTCQKVPKYTPIFMVGFPRSGTTLLDSVIDTQKNAVTLSETATLFTTICAFKKLNKTYPNDLLTLKDSEINFLRNVYYDFVETLNLKINDETLVIDKLPHNTVHLPLILTLFPEAKIIFSIRHPLDVCLSNLQQNFSINIENSHLTTLRSCVRRYRQIFTLFESYQENLKPTVYFVKYEDLIDNFTEEVNKIFKYLNIDNNERYDNFHKHAQTQIITTSSNKQVTQALYANAKYRWKHYQKHLLPFASELQKQMNKFGYEI